jgi:hypothetical protein
MLVARESACPVDARPEVSRWRPSSEPLPGGVGRGSTAAAGVRPGAVPSRPGSRSSARRLRRGAGPVASAIRPVVAERMTGGERGESRLGASPRAGATRRRPPKRLRLASAVSIRFCRCDVPRDRRDAREDWTRIHLGPVRPRWRRAGPRHRARSSRRERAGRGEGVAGRGASALEPGRLGPRRRGRGCVWSGPAADRSTSGLGRGGCGASAGRVAPRRSHGVQLAPGDPRRAGRAGGHVPARGLRRGRAAGSGGEPGRPRASGLHERDVPRGGHDRADTRGARGRRAAP